MRFATIQACNHSLVEKNLEVYMARRIGSWLLAFAIVMTAGPAPVSSAPAPGSGTITGRVFQSDARTPVRAAVVKAFNRTSEETFQSAATGPDGSYTLQGLAPGEYDLGISTEAGIFVVDDAMKLATHQKRAVSFALQPDAQEQQPEDGAQGEDPQAESGDASQSEATASEPEEQQKQKPRKPKRPRSKAARKNTPWVTTGVIVGAALVVGVLSSGRGDSNGSPN
jgi:carboxypeptidase family protein